MNIALVVATLALSACDCAGDRAPAGDQDGNAAVEQKRTAAQEQEKPREPTEVELRVQKVRHELADQGLDPQIDETLPTRLGNRPECSPIERRRYNLAGELVYVIVGTYRDEAAAEACILAYQHFLADLWPTYQNDFYRLGRYVIELNPKMTQEQKDKARAAVQRALAN